MASCAIMWFRRDLRLSDNPALFEAAQHERVLPIWIDDDAEAGDLAPGAAARVWRHHALAALDSSMGGQLNFRCGPAKPVLEDLMDRFNVEAIYWNRCYEPWRTERDSEIKAFLEDRGAKARSFNGSLLFEPWTVRKQDGKPYKVFTPFYRKGCLAADPPRTPLPVPKGVNLVKDEKSRNLQNSGYLSNQRWCDGIMKHWDVGETEAQAKLARFAETGLGDYKDGRNFPARKNVSRLSPHLQSGELSPNQAWHAIRNAASDKNADHFCSELGWREFSYSLLFQYPELHRRNLQTKFDAFPWREPDEDLIAWQKGMTGIPVVDAGMRELWQTGYMHNRVRMILGSFLVKNLLIHWRHGERWFWDTLVDADSASNSASWQWVAGCGADAAPYFRIFNPVSQGQKFDPDGRYVRQFIPEIASLPDKFLFCPWEAPAHILAEAGITLGKDYPKPIVDLKQSRSAALNAFQSLKKEA